MKRIIILLLSTMSFIVFNGCSEYDGVRDTSRIREVKASFDYGMTTRVGLSPDAGSQDMITKWQDGDKVHLYLTKGIRLYDIGTVPVRNITDDGKCCTFQYGLPDGVEDDASGYELTGFTVACSPKIQDDDIFYNASRIRKPIDQFKVPVMFDQYVNEANIFASFRHYGLYEIVHITNNTDEAIDFSLCDFSVATSWYKQAGGIRLFDGEFVTDLSFERNDKSPATSIPAHGSDMIVSWYMPNGNTIQEATMVAEINGEFVHSTNTISSNVTLCTGIAYHMYATWDGTELKFGKNGIETSSIIKVEPTKIDFGQVPVGVSKTEHFTVSNVGGANLTFSVSELHEEFDIPESGTQFTLAPGEEKVFSVTFSSNLENHGAGAIVRIFSDADNGTQILELEATTHNTGVEDETITVNGVSFKMIAVEGGTFMMGAEDTDPDAYDDEKPQHQVTLSSFYIGETEVTQELWEAVMGVNPSYIHGDNLPVNQITREDCKEFFNKLKVLTGREFRLPTEAEWEYAARGGKKSQGYKYAGSNNINLVAWYDQNSNGVVQPVGQKKANELGLYDMSGNVWEFTQDYYDEDYYSISPVYNPCNTTESYAFTMRGGGAWNFNRFCRVSMRADQVLYNDQTPVDSNWDMGLRLVLRIPL